jgi:hypothetical protein
MIVVECFPVALPSDLAPILYAYVYGTLFRSNFETFRNSTKVAAG